MNKVLKKYYMMNKSPKTKTFLSYEKLLYVKFQEKIKEDEILTKSFNELGIFDDFSYKLVYFYEDNATHIFLAKFDDILKDYSFIIPEPLIFIAYIKKYRIKGKNLFLVYKEKYVILVEYQDDRFQFCQTILLIKLDLNFKEKLKISYENVIEIDGINFTCDQNMNLYKDLLDINVDFKLNLSSNKKFKLKECLSFKFLIALISGSFIAFLIILFVLIKNYFIQKEIAKMEILISEQKQSFNFIKEKEKHRDKISQEYDEILQKINTLKIFYNDTVCYKHLYNFIKVLNLHNIFIESLEIEKNKFVIEISRDYEFYDDYKKYNFILKNKEIYDDKVKLFFEINL
ncbi:hypothetical protein [Campylobacter insulaenigrae]|uniref:hypothetical protein n=1 Tax=Campylobacter insulaenigrae TaxID=260714 RepID=UPI000F83D69C|nr:hypothetical protein [Campylobacter insulaenigrae]MCR6590686.1 hypothetical protein [Campylobacter insulaenigrae]MCR6592223.1 hypothetical protein [Campylobacter insulaenigrae]